MVTLKKMCIDKYSLCLNFSFLFYFYFLFPQPLPPTSSPYGKWFCLLSTAAIHITDLTLEGKAPNSVLPCMTTSNSTGRADVKLRPNLITWPLPFPRVGPLFTSTVWVSRTLCCQFSQRLSGCNFANWSTMQHIILCILGRGEKTFLISELYYKYYHWGDLFFYVLMFLFHCVHIHTLYELTFH